MITTHSREGRVVLDERASDNTAAAVVDVCGIYFEPDGWQGYFNGFVERAPGYIRRFGTKIADRAGVDPVRYMELVDSEPLAAVEYLVSGSGFRIAPSEYVASLRAQSVHHQVLHGYPWATPSGTPVNDQLARVCHGAPDILQAWAGLDMRRPEAAAKELQRCVRELGMKGGTLIPFMDGVRADSESCMPIYRAAESLGVPLWIHCGTNLAGNLRIDLSGWLEIDRIAAAFPRLKIVVGHGGWPWVLQFCAVCQRHPNVFLDISTYRPRLMASSGSGWEPLFLYGSGAIAGQVLFGATQWVHSLSIRQLADELADVLAPKVAQRWLRRNAAGLLQLPAGVQEQAAASTCTEGELHGS